MSLPFASAYRHGFARIAACTIPVFTYSGLYRMVVRYFDLKVLWTSGGSLACLVGLTYALSFLVNFSHLPRTGLLIYWFIAFAYVVISRFVARALLMRSQQSRQVGNECAPLRVAIFGAGVDFRAIPPPPGVLRCRPSAAGACSRRSPPSTEAGDGRG